MPRRAPFRVGVAAAAVLLPLLAGCSAPSGADRVDLPDSVVLEVLRQRADLAGSGARIRVENGSGAPIVVESARLGSSSLDGPAEWAGDAATIRPGGVLELPIELSGPVCPPQPAGAREHEVELGFSGEGGAGTARRAVEDPYEQLAAYVASACLRADVERIARVSAVSVAEQDGRIRVELAVEPTGADGAFEVVSARSSVLLALLDADGERVATSPVGARVAGGGPPSVIPLVFAPARCDPHAIAEDKLGTVMRLDVVLGGGGGGVLQVAMPDELRGETLGAVLGACGTG